MVVESAPEPVSWRSLPIDTCSTYVPGAIRIVSPELLRVGARPDPDRGARRGGVHCRLDREEVAGHDEVIRRLPRDAGTRDPATDQYTETAQRSDDSPYPVPKRQFPMRLDAVTMIHASHDCPPFSASHGRGSDARSVASLGTDPP